METKKCKCCGEEQPIVNFKKRKMGLCISVHVLRHKTPT